MGSSVFLRGQPRPIPPFLGPPTYTQTFWPRATKFCMVTKFGMMCGTTVFVGGQAPPKVWGQKHPKIFGTYYACTQYEKQQPNFARRSNYMWGKFVHCRPQTLTRDLFAVANLLLLILYYVKCFLSYSIFFCSLKQFTAWYWMVLMDLCNKKQWKLMEIREHVYTLTLV